MDAAYSATSIKNQQTDQHNSADRFDFLLRENNYPVKLFYRYYIIVYRLSAVNKVYVDILIF